MIKLRNSALTAGLVTLAVAMPATASARVLDNPSGSGELPSGAATEVGPTTASNSGFAWDDAGIGAGAVLLVVGLGAAVAAAPARRRVRHLSTTSS